MHFYKLVVGVALLLLIASGDLSAIPRSGGIPTLGPGAGTLAAAAFCKDRPDECTFDPTEPASIRLTPAVYALIEKVNVAVNAEIVPMTDQAHWGVVDRWDYPDDGKGDCEDFQLEKRRRLVAAGLPKRALLMAVVLDADGDSHAVLIARTTLGDYVLDNMTPAVLGWRDTDLVFRQREDGAGGWVRLQGRGQMAPAG